MATVEPEVRTVAESPADDVSKPVGKAEEKPKRQNLASHPPYFQMIKSALLALNEKGGSSPYAIAKFMEEKHKAVLPRNFRKILGLQLKNSVTKGNLIKIRASYKLSEAATKKGKNTVVKEKKPKLTIEKAASTGAPKRKRSVKTTSEGAKKKVGAKLAKKSTPVKPKQPKSIKSTAGKKAKKSAA